MRFEWSEAKDKLNREKHGISFAEAASVFEDPLHLSILDTRYSYFEERWISIGQAVGKKILVVAHLFYDTEGEERVRILSAREATRNERRQYEKL